MHSLSDTELWDCKPAVDEAFRLAMRHRREELGLSASKAAELSGFDNNSIFCRAEKGEFGLQLSNAWRIARGLGTTIDELMELGEYLQNQEQARARKRSR